MEIKTFTIDLDKSPETRWTEVISLYRNDILKVLKETENMLGNQYFLWMATKFFSLLANVGLVLYDRELQGIAQILDLPIGKVAMLQLAYEFCTCCTSILVKDDNKVYHFRTMDWEMKSLKPITVNVKFIKNGNTILKGTTWPGYVGILTAMKPNEYSISINYRRLNESFLKNIYYGLTSCWPISFLVRHVLTECNNYKEAKYILEEANLMAPVYIIISGKNEGCIITRDRIKSVEPLNMKDNDILVQTNIDHWRDDDIEHNWQDIDNSRERRKYAYTWLKNYAKIDIINKEMIWNLLYSKPIYARDTLYMTGMCASDNYYETKLS